MNREDEIIEKLNELSEKVSVLFDKPVKKSPTKKDRKEEFKNQFKKNHLKQISK